MNNSPFDVHPFNFRNQSKTFDILGETTTSPQIILFSNGTILASQFMLSKNYPDTLIILKNFIKTKMTELRLGSYVPLSISVVDSTWYGQDNILNVQKQNIITQDTFKHCGMTSVAKGF